MVGLPSLQQHKHHVVDAMNLPGSIKQAALVLHGLAPADCDWMLAQLPANQQQPLRTALAELRNLGVPADPNLTRTAAAASRVAALQSADHQVVEAADASTIASALRGEPEAVQAAAIALHAWSWRKTVRAQLRISTQAQTTWRRGEQGQAFRASLTAALAKHLPRTRTAVPKKPEKTSQLQSWLSVFKGRKA